MRFLLFTAAYLLALPVQAQFGFRAYYGTMSSESATTTDAILYSGATTVDGGGFVEFGLDYWLQPWEERRVELTPALLYSLGSYGADLTGYDYSAGSLVLNARIYPMDFEGDCNCPTFSKDGNFISKGFFFEVSPGLLYNSWRLQSDTYDPTALIDERVSNITWRASIGAGIDIGLSDLITLSPSVLYQARGGHVPYAALQQADPRLDGDPAGIGSGFMFGLRIGIRADTNNYGYR